MTPRRLLGFAPAKINLALVVGPLLGSGKHEVVTVLQALDLRDDIEVAESAAVGVDGFADDTIVTRALERLREETGATLRARLTKRVPVAAGLGGGSSDAAAALRLGNELLGRPVALAHLASIAGELGADVPFFLGPPQQLGEDDGARLTPVSLPADYVVVLARPVGEAKESTGAVYAAFDARGGADGFEGRRHALLDSLAGIRRSAQLAALPPNDLAWSPLATDLRALGAFRADVSGAGPVVYGLFERYADAERAVAAIAPAAETWLARPLTG
ncbi:MAG: hypothetical protein U0R50_00985 [Gaiellales bacterium]